MSSKYNFVEGTNRCPKCEEQNKDNAGDNFMWYGESQGGFCWSCRFTIPSEEFKTGNKLEKGDVTILQKDIDSLANKALTEEQLESIHNSTVDKISVKYRGMDNTVCKELGVRWKVDSDGKPLEMLYPCTIKEDGELRITGYKVRQLPKTFYSIGYVGKMCGFIGNTDAVAETLIITGGEIDLITIIGALKDDKYRKDFNVVSSPLGEPMTAQFIKLNYDWVDAHKKIIIALDNDEAGNLAFEEVKKVVDNSKLYKANLRHVDANQYLKEGDADKLPADVYWNAQAVKSHGIIGSAGIFEKIIETAKVERIPLPPFLYGLKPIFGDGIALGEICNIVSSVSTGKSSFVNEIMLYWMMNSPHRLLIVTLEDDVGNYGSKIASRATGVNILAMQSTEEKIELLNEYEDEINKYLINEDGSSRFEIMEKIPSNIDDLQKAIVQSIKINNTKVILLDPIQSIIGSKSLEEQILFMQFQEDLKRDYNVTIINVAHTKKSSGEGKQHSEGGSISEEQIKGSSQISATATINILLTRDKMNPDPIIRNTTNVSVSKNRGQGVTGRDICKVYYSLPHHTLFDFDYAEKNNFFIGMDNKQLKDVMDNSKAQSVTNGVSIDSDLDESMGVF